MTAVVDEAGTEPEVDEAAADRRARRSTLLVLGVLALLVAALLGRWAFASYARSQVAVVVPDRPLECSPTNDGDPGTTPGGAAIVRADMTCTLTVQVTNDGPTAVQIEDVWIPVVGPTGGAAVKADGIDPGRRSELPTGPTHPGVDALFGIERTIAPGETIDFAVTFFHNPNGCASKGWRLGVEPKVVVRSLGLRGYRHSTGETVEFLATTDLNDCTPGDPPGS